MNILALVAHPDDAEFSVAGTLYKYKRQGHNIFIALTTSGNQGSNTHKTRKEIAAVREKEQLAAARLLGAKVRFLRYDDQGLLDTTHSRKSVIDAIRWANPDVILTHYPSDPSTDHGTTGKIAGEVMLSLPGKLIPADEKPIFKKPSLFFFDTAAGIDFLPEAYVDISEVFDLKIQTLSKHQSQIAWMGVFAEDNLIELCRARDRVRGMQYGCQYAEAYRAFRLHGYMPDFRLLP